MATSTDTVPTIEKIEELDRIYNVLISPQGQKELIYLYSISECEFCRNGKNAPEIGNSREDDLKAVLNSHIGDEFNCNIDDNIDNGADCMLNELISIKHIGTAIGKGSIKAKWTSDRSKAEDYIKQMLLLENKNYTHLLLVYIDVKKQHTVQIIAISSKQMLDAVKNLKENAFKIGKEGTNIRGIEYSTEMIQLLIKKKYFQIDIPNVELKGGVDSIKRRQLLLESLRST
jgi:hypothetical protein